jgi:RimJ/RimL family protein N-acetyltransferase
VIALRPVEPADLPVFYEHQRDPVAAERVRWVPRDRDAFDAHWAKIMADPDVLLRTVVVDGAVAGSVVSWTHEGRRDVGYWLGREFWGRGVATAALRAFVAEDGHRPLYADPFDTNAASVAVLRRCGFTEVERATGPEGTQVLLVLEP